LVDVLMARGLDINQGDEEGITPIFRVAQWRGHCARRLSSPKIFRGGGRKQLL